MTRKDFLKFVGLGSLGALVAPVVARLPVPKTAQRRVATKATWDAIRKIGNGPPNLFYGIEYSTKDELPLYFYLHRNPETGAVLRAEQFPKTTAVLWDPDRDSYRVTAWNDGHVYVPKCDIQVVPEDYNVPFVEDEAMNRAAKEIWDTLAKEKLEWHRKGLEDALKQAAEFASKQTKKIAGGQCKMERNGWGDMHSCLDLRVPLDRMCLTCRAKMLVKK